MVDVRRKTQIMGINRTTIQDIAICGSGEVKTCEGCTQIIRTADLVLFPANSGGESICVSGQWCSGNVHSVVVKSISGNQDVFIGGSGCKPYSGHGFLLDPKETVTLDVCNPCIVYGYATHSGDRVTWIGTDY